LRVDGDYVWSHRRCAACGATFRIRWLYVRTIYVLAHVSSFGIAFAVGNRGHALIALALLIVLPICWGMLMISLRLFPVDIDVVGAGWTPGDSEADQELASEFAMLRELDAVVGWAEPEASPPTPVDSSASPAGRPPLSTPRDTPITFEGVAIAIALAALLAYNVYIAVEPHVTLGKAPTESSAPPVPRPTPGR
jgi:hypothetical protein